MLLGCLQILVGVGMGTWVGVVVVVEVVGLTEVLAQGTVMVLVTLLGGLGC